MILAKIDEANVGLLLRSFFPLALSADRAPLQACKRLLAAGFQKMVTNPCGMPLLDAALVKLGVSRPPHLGTCLSSAQLPLRFHPR